MEIETLLVAGRLEDDAAQRIDQRFAALEPLRESNVQIERMIAANEEVERPVRSRIASGPAEPRPPERPGQSRTSLPDH